MWLLTVLWNHQSVILAASADVCDDTLVLQKIERRVKTYSIPWVSPRDQLKDTTPGRCYLHDFKCRSFSWCYRFLDTFANTHAHKDKVTIQKSALLYNKNLRGCFTRCCTLLNWFEPGLDSLRLSHSNWVIKITEYALMRNWKRFSSFVFALFCLHRISSWVTIYLLFNCPSLFVLSFTHFTSVSFNWI